VEIVRTLLGLAGTLAGAELLVVNASALAGRLGVPQVVIGFTVVALGTSLPELVTSVQAQRRGESDLLVGNLLGSNMFNALFGGGLVGLAARTPGAGGAGVAVLVVMVLVSVLAWGLLVRGLRFTRPEAAILLTVYVLTVPLLA
jgi:cation:H+ antiporter